MGLGRQRGPRLQVPGLTGNIRVAPGAAAVPSFVRPRLPVVPGIGQLGVPTASDIEAIGKPLVKLLQQEQVKDAESGKAQGRAFADNPETRKQLESELGRAAAGDPKKLRTFINSLVDDGSLNEAETLGFQVGLLQRQAENSARAARAQLLGRVDEFSVISGPDGEPVESPDLEQAIADAFANAPGADLVSQSEFSSKAFNDARVGVTNEIRERVTQARTQNIQADHRRFYGDKIGQQLTGLAFANTDQVDELLGELQTTIDVDGDGKHVANNQKLIADRAVLVATEVARTDPKRAVALLRTIRDRVSARGALLGAKGTETRATLETAIQDVRHQDQQEESRELQLRTQKLNAAETQASGIAHGIFFDAIRDGEPIRGATTQALAEIGQDSFIRQQLGIGDDEDIPEDFLGRVKRTLRQLERAARDDVGESDPFVLRALHNMELGDKPASRESIISAAESAVLSGRLSFVDFEKIRDRQDRIEPSTRLMTENPVYRSNVADQLAESKIPSGFPIGVSQELAGERLDTLNAARDFIQERVEAAGTDLTAQERALEQASRSPEVQEKVRAYQSKLRERTNAYNSSLAQIQQSIDSFDFDAADSQLSEAQRSQAIGGADLRTLQQARIRKAQDQDRILLQGTVSNNSQASLQSEMRALLKAQKLPAGVEQATINQAIDQLQANLSEVGGRLLRTERPGDFANAYRREASRIVEEIVAPFRPTEQARPADLASRRAVENVAKIEREFAQAELVHRGAQTRQTALQSLQIPSLSAQGLYERATDIGQGGIFTSKEAATSRVLADFAEGTLLSPADVQGKAYISLFALDRIPYTAAIADSVTVERSFNLIPIDSLAAKGMRELQRRNPDSDLANFRGALGMRKKDAERAAGYFESIGLTATIEPRKGTALPRVPGSGLYRVRVTNSIDLKNEELPAFGVRYFDTIETYDALNDATRGKFLGRLGFTVDSKDALEAASKRFREDQILTIRDSPR